MSSFMVFALIIFSAGAQAFSAENQKADRIRIGYSSISSSRIALWATSDMGFFKKQGLAAEVIVTPGIQGTQALMFSTTIVGLPGMCLPKWRPIARE